MQVIEIENAFSLIYKHQQWVGFELEGFEQAVYLPYDEINKKGIPINEIELLKGSSLKPIFYEEDDVLYNGEIADNRDDLIKGFSVEMKDSIENLWKINSRHLQPYQRIEYVFTYIHKGELSVGFNIGDNQEAVFYKLNYLKAITGLEADDLEVLKGAYINPDYYNAGENLGDLPFTVQKSNAIVSRLNLRLPNSIVELTDRKSFPMTNFLVGPKKFKEMGWLYTENEYGGWFGNNDILVKLENQTHPKIAWYYHWWNILSD